MAIKASDNFKTYKNPNGPDITTVARPVFEAEGLYCKDIDGTGKLSAVAKNTSSIMPHYSKPAAAKSAVQQDCEGKDITFDAFGFAYNRYFIHDILRGQMGFRGYINSDTGIVHNMSWGVEELDIAERIGFAVNNSGVDVISGLYDNAAAKEAYERATNGYYDGRQLPYGLTPDMVTLNDAVIDRAVTRTLTEMFELGMFEHTYRCAKKAKETISAYREAAGNYYELNFGLSF